MTNMYRYDREITMNPTRFWTSKGLLLGEGDRDNKIRIPEEFLEGHTLILGKSGTGKSNLVRNLIRQIEENTSSNVILLDPHGTLLDGVISSNPTKDLVYLSPGIISSGDSKKAVSFNMIGIDNLEDDEIERITGWIRDMMAGEESISSGSWGPRLEVIFKVVLPELFRQMGRIRLIDLAETLSGKQEMKKFISRIADGPKKKFIEAQYQDWRSWSQYISSTMNRLLPLLSSSSTRYLVSGDSDSVELHDEMQGGGKLIALNISKTSFPDESIRIITSLFLLKIWTGILKGFGKSRKKEDIYIVIDEFQAIPARIIETFLREGRKFGIKLILASQFLNFDEKELKQAVFGNVRNFITFNLQDRDAEEISRMMPERRDQITLLETIKGQRLHKAVVMSQTDDGLAGPISFKPYFENMDIDLEELDTIKLRSLEKYSAEIHEEEVSPSEKTLHEAILDGLENILSRHEIEMSRSVRIGESVADGVFSYHGVEFIVEVEVSDISNKFRLLSKLTRYGKRPLILVSPSGKAGEMHRMISNPTGMRQKDGFVLEVPLMDGQKKLYARDIAHAIPTTLLLEYDEGKLRSYWNNNTRGFLIKHLHEKFTFQRELDSGEFSEARNYIFRLMVTGEKFAIKKSELLDNSPIRYGLMNKFIEKNCQKDSDFVFLEDLFN